jgi:hypothetical protein
MALFMDVHNKVDGLTAEAVSGAHQRDLEVQQKYGVDYRQYWFDEASGKVFCLVEAPDADAAAAVHREAHGLVADEIVPVHEARSCRSTKARRQRSRRVGDPGSSGPHRGHLPFP